MGLFHFDRDQPEMPKPFLANESSLTPLISKVILCALLKKASCFLFFFLEFFGVFFRA